MTLPRPDSVAAAVNTPGPRLADLPAGQKLLLVGVSEPLAGALGTLYRMAERVVPTMRLCLNATQAMSSLADESFDCVLVVNQSVDLTQRGIDAHNFCLAVRASGCQDAVLVLSATVSDALYKVTCEADVELYVGPAPWRSQTLVMLIDRAIQQRSVALESQRRAWLESQRLDREREDCAELLNQQRQLLGATGATAEGSLTDLLPPEIPTIYRELLRVSVLTGTSSLSAEISKLVRMLALVHLTPRQVLQLHLEQVETLVKGIGQRSARHLMDRTNVLGLELLVALCECLEEQNARTWWAWRRQPVADLGVSLERRAA